MLPTGEEELYPFDGLWGCEQIFEAVGTGTQLVVDGEELVVGFADVVGFALVTGQVYTVVE